MQHCHARFYYYWREVYHQEVPESYPEHPFDRGFHFSFTLVFLPRCGRMATVEVGSCRACLLFRRCIG